MPSHQVRLYTRRGCHLCDVAKDQLLRHGLSPQEVDIDADPELCERFTNCVPVVEIDGKVRFRGRIDERLLRRLLQAPRQGNHAAAEPASRVSAGRSTSDVTTRTSRQP
jgi:glutaredoxin